MLIWWMLPGLCLTYCRVRCQVFGSVLFGVLGVSKPPVPVLFRLPGVTLYLEGVMVSVLPSVRRC